MREYTLVELQAMLKAALALSDVVSADSIAELKRMIADKKPKGRVIY
jgi:hypothetical protein